MKQDAHDIFHITQDMSGKKSKVLFFFSNHNGLSVIVNNYVKQLSGKYNKFIDFEYYELEKDTDVFRNTKITMTPTIFFMNENKLVDYVTGPISKNQLKEKIEAIEYLLENKGEKNEY